MKILIQARLGRYERLYPEFTQILPTEFNAFANDIHSESAGKNPALYGKSLYSISLSADGAIFTKLILGEDVIRDALGYVSISIFVANNKRLPGEDVKVLLDDLINTYRANYIVDNKIDRKSFDWALFTSLANSYDSKLKERSLNINFESGKKDPAYHYYYSESQLIELLDNPYQEEYSDYKQVYLIDANIKSDNPIALGAWKHSGNKVNPDLENKYYRLINNSIAKVVITNVDGNRVNIVRTKSQIKVYYSKDDDCFYPIETTGSLYDQSSDIHNYLEIRGEQVVVKNEAFSNPKPKEKAVTFEIKDRKGNQINNAKIQIDSQPRICITGSKHTYTFKGNEIKQTHKVSVKKDVFKGTISIVPLGAIGNQAVILEERKIIPIHVKDEDTGHSIDNCEVWTFLTDGFKKIKQLEFVDDQINKSYTIKVKKAGYNEYEYNFIPHQKERIDITLTKSKTTKDITSSESIYEIYAGDSGKLRDADTYKSKRRKVTKIKNFRDLIKANEGYRFTHFELNNRILTAQYKKRKNYIGQTINYFRKPKAFAGLVVVLITFGVVLFMHKYCSSTEEFNNVKKEITSYIEEDEFLFSTIDSLSKEWEKKKPMKKEKSIELIKLIKKDYKGKLEIWNETKVLLTNAISLRQKIDSLNFEAIKGADFKDFQSKTNDIDSIYSTKYRILKDSLGDVSKMPFNELVDFIKSKLRGIEQLEEESGVTKEAPKTGAEVHVPPYPSETGNNINNKGKVGQSQSMESNTSEILEYLKGNELDKEILNEYKKNKKTADNVKKSISLCLEFWELNGSGSGRNANTYSAFRKKVKKDNNLKDSKLMEFLDSVYKADQPSYASTDKIKGLASI